MCQTILSRLGAGRKGKELRDEFEGSPYGWPGDAVDGALYVLAHAGAMRTLDEAGREIVLRTVQRQKIGVCRFLPETHTVSLSHRKAIRQLGVTVNVTVAPEQEAEQLPLILERLREASRAAGGDAPAPAMPAAPELDAVAQLAGNERLIEAASRAKALQDGYAACIAAAQAIAARRPAYETTRRLVELGAHGQQAALDDVRANRRLLEEPDPVPPLRQAAAAELRQRLNAAADGYAAAFADANARLDADPHWQKLSPEDRHSIRVEMGLLEVPRPAVATPEDIVTALTGRSLSGWADLAQSLPAKVQQALDEAAARFEPKARGGETAGAWLDRGYGSGGSLAGRAAAGAERCSDRRPGAAAAVATRVDAHGYPISQSRRPEWIARSMCRCRLMRRPPRRLKTLLGGRRPVDT